MTDKQTQAAAPATNMEKDPAKWVTGDEPMTGAQQSYLKTLSEQAGVDFDPSLTKAHASQRIDELQQQTGRGLDAKSSSEDAHAKSSGAHAKPPSDAESPSVAGEEDPGASEDDPEMRQALQGEARAARK